MGRKIFQIIFVILVLAAFAKTIGDYLSKLISDPSEFEFHIESAPGGELSRTSNLTFTFAQDFESEKFKLNEPINQNLIHFTPRINGTFYWINARTLEFLPKEPLPSNTNFYYRINLNNIYETKERLSIYRSKFSTPPIKFDVNFSHLSYVDSSHFKINGLLSFTDQIDFKTIHQLMTVKQGALSLPIQIKQSERDLSYKFIIDNVIRKPNSDSVIIYWYTNIELNEQNSIGIAIPGLNDFEILSTQLSYDNGTHINIKFSNRLAENPDSLINVIGANVDSQKAINNHYHITINDTSISESLAFNINKNFSSLNGLKLKADYYKKLIINNYVPQIANIQKLALINLSPEHTFLPLKTKNLKTINIDVYEVPKQNALQFLQISQKDLSEEIKRVGKKIDGRKFNLAQLVSYQDNLLKEYQIPFNYLAPQKGSIVYYQTHYGPDDLAFSNKDSLVKQYDTISQSITYTPLQTIVKITPTDTLLVQVFNTKEGEKARNAKVEIFDFQQHKLSSIQTNKYGEVRIKFSSDIAFVRISHQGFVSYVPLNYSDMQSSSNYLNPFFFSNQNSYQAKDSIHLGLIFDPDHLLNKSINKIRYELISPQGKLIYATAETFRANTIIVFKHRLPNKIANGYYKAKFTLNNHSIQKTININTASSYKKLCGIEETYPNYDSIISLNFAKKVHTPTPNQDSNKLGFESFYRPNDTIRLSIPTKHTTHAHYSIENKGQILTSEWIKPENNQLKLKIITRDYFGPNAEFSLQLFNPNGEVITHTHSIKITDRNKTIKPVLISKFDFESGEQETIRVKEAKGKALKYVIKLSTPIDTSALNPITHFNQNFRSTVETYGYFNEKKDLNPEQASVSINKQNEATSGYHRFYGPFNLIAGASNNHKLDIPNVLDKGSIEIIAMGVETESYGYQKKDIHINKPIMVQFDKPAYLQPNEVAYIKAKLTINQAQSTTLKIDFKNPSNCSFYDETQFELPMNMGKNYFEFYFKIKTNKVCENASFTIHIEDSIQSYEQKIAIPTYSLNPVNTQLISTSIKSQSEWQTRITPKGYKGSNKGNIEFSNHPSTSHTYLLKKLSDHKYDDLPTRIALCNGLINYHKISELEQKEKDSIQQLISQCLNELTLLMNSNSSFELSYLDKTDNQSFNLMAGQLFIEAQQNGYWINTRVLNNWTRNLQFTSEFTDLNDPLRQELLAKQLYLLSQIKEANIKLINDLERINEITPLSKLYLALAYQNLGEKRKAQKIYKELQSTNSKLNFEETLLLFELCHLLKDNTEREIHLTKVYEHLINKNPYSNAELSQYLNLTSKYLGEGKALYPIDVSYRLNKGKENSINNVKTISYEQIPIEFTLPKTIDIKNHGESTTYTHITISGVPEIPGPIKAKSPIKLSTHYYDSSGNEFSPNNLYLNQCFRSELVVTNYSNQTFKNIVIVMPYASGWVLDALEETNTNFYLLSSQDNHLNKLNYMVQVPGKSKVRIPLSFTAKYPGNYYLSPIRLIHQESNQVWQQTKIGYSNVAQELQPINNAKNDTP